MCSPLVLYTVFPWESTRNKREKSGGRAHKKRAGVLRNQWTLEKALMQRSLSSFDKRNPRTVNVTQRPSCFNPRFGHDKLKVSSFMKLMLCQRRGSCEWLFKFNTFQFVLPFTKNNNLQFPTAHSKSTSPCRIWCSVFWDLHSMLLKMMFFNAPRLALVLYEKGAGRSGDTQAVCTVTLTVQATWQEAWQVDGT